MNLRFLIRKIARIEIQNKISNLRNFCPSDQNLINEKVNHLFHFTSTLTSYNF